MDNQSDLVKPVRPTTACTECQRRKQKCSREWPCNHCQARRIAHLCKFAPKRSLKTATRAAANEKRALEPCRQQNGGVDPDVRGNTDTQKVVKEEDFRALGYLSDIPNISEEAISENPGASSASALGIRSQEMENALQAIPPKTFADILVQYFLDNINYKYYVFYPQTFSSDYYEWWIAKANGSALSPEFTALLLHLCACTVLFVDSAIRHKLESELGENIQMLSRRYHHLAKQLSSTIPPGKGGLIQVQQLFLNCLWFKTEALFVESWHSLSAAIHEAQELGMHKDSSKGTTSEFDREMRRRVWCLLYSWDWQMSLLLSRPFIINSNYCSFEVPNMRLEKPECEDGLPSPVAHVALQCQLGHALSKIPGVMGGVLSPSQAVSIQQEVEAWFASFPAAFKLFNPDTRWDNSQEYISEQRSQLYVIGYMVMLLPLKQCLTRTIDHDTISIEKSLQPIAIDCSLKLLEVSQQHLDFLGPMKANFHFAPFLIFDTAAFLCSALIHDHHKNLPRRDKLIAAIDTALGALKNTSKHSKTSSLCHTILSKLRNSIPSESKDKDSIGPTDSQQPSRSHLPPDTQPTVTTTDPNVSLQPPISPLDVHKAGLDPYPSLGLSVSDEPPAEMMLADIPNMDLGELSQIWDWDNLDLSIPYEVSL